MHSRRHALRMSVTGPPPRSPHARTDPKRVCESLIGKRKIRSNRHCHYWRASQHALAVGAYIVHANIQIHFERAGACRGTGSCPLFSGTADSLLFHPLFGMSRRSVILVTAPMYMRKVVWSPSPQDTPHTPKRRPYKSCGLSLTTFRNFGQETFWRNASCPFARHAAFHPPPWCHVRTRTWHCPS